jgi:hypothetical protein
MPNIPCARCSKIFYAKPYFIRRGHARFCSAACHHQSNRTGDMVSCYICKKKIYRTKYKQKRSESKKFFCSKSCQFKWRNVEFSGDKSANWKEGRYVYRLLLLKHSVPKACVLCGLDDLRVLAAHHIDENRQNNKVENLAWLCHNCHYLVHHDKLEKQIFASKLEGLKPYYSGNMVAMV